MFPSFMLWNFVFKKIPLPRLEVLIQVKRWHIALFLLLRLLRWNSSLTDLLKELTECKSLRSVWHLILCWPHLFCRFCLSNEEFSIIFGHLTKKDNSIKFLLISFFEQICKTWKEDYEEVRRHMSSGPCKHYSPLFWSYFFYNNSQTNIW